MIGRALGGAPWLFLLLAITLQIRAGAILLPADLLESDPPGHFATGVMVHDFVRHPSLQPLPFAKCFYVQYPKVAFGHWPPVFYVIEAAWFLLFGANVAAARVLCACIAGVCALALYVRCRERWGGWYAAAFSATFLALPIIQRESWRIMSDLLLALFVFLALGSLSDFFTTEKRKHALWFAAWSSLAILTKGTGWLLFVPIVGGPLITGRPRLYFTWVYWIALALIGILAAPFFLWMSVLKLGYPTSIQDHLYRTKVLLAQLTIIHYVAGGLLLLVLLAAIYRFWPRRELAPGAVLSVLLVLWVATQVLLISLVTLTPELKRYYLPSMAPMAFLIAGAVFTLDGWFASRGLGYGKIFAAMLCTGALVISGVPALGSTTAFSKAIASIPVNEGHKIILVESDAAGEGAMIAARLEQDRNRSSYMLRSTKILSTSLWSGRNYSLRYHDPAGVRDALERNFVAYVVLDMSAPATPAVALLETVLRDPTSGWQLAARTPVAYRQRRGDILIYRRESSGADGVPTSVSLGPERGSQAITCGDR